jgi:hypothetical protein
MDSFRDTTGRTKIAFFRTEGGRVPPRLLHALDVVCGLLRRTLG